MLREHVLQHRALEQRRVAERRGGEHHALRAAGLHLFQQEAPLVLAPLVVLGGGRCRPVQERLREFLERLAVGRDVVEQPARDQHEVVVDHVAAGHLDRLDETERRLLAERAVDHHARVVALRPRQLVDFGEVLAHEFRVVLRRQHHARAEQQVDLGGRRLPGLLRAVRVEVADRGPVLVVDRDRRVQLRVGDRRAAQRSEPVAQHLEFVHVVVAADRVLVVLRDVEVADVLVLEQDLPHAGQVADHVADRREEHPVEAVEPAGEAQFDRRARDPADVALVVGVALDHLEAVAAAQDPDRQHARRVDDLARHVDRHVADRLATRRGGLPLLDRVEVEVLEHRLAGFDDLDGAGRGRGAHQWCSQAGGRRARKAASPSFASRVFISPCR